MNLDEQTLVGRAVAVHQRPEVGLDLNGNEVVVVVMTVELRLSEPATIDLGSTYTLTPVSPLVVKP